MKKGFTLIEVLTVIIILGVLSLIIIPNVMTIVDKKQKDLYKAQIKEIESNAKLWAETNLNFLSKTNAGDEYTIYLGQLKLAGFTSKDIKNPINDECFSNDTPIKLTILENSIEYYVVDNVNESNNVDNCDFPGQNEFIELSLYGKKESINYEMDLQRSGEYNEPGWYIIKNGLPISNVTVTKTIESYKDQVLTVVNSVDSNADVDYYIIRYTYEDPDVNRTFTQERKINLVD